MNNNTNKSPVVGEQMNNTTHKTEERRFQEERRDVMKMDRFFTGLVALVAGLALSAGSAYATKGYLTGDSAPAKLVPYYEIGDTKATIIGVHNMASGDNDTQECRNTGGTLFANLADFPRVCLRPAADPADDPIAPVDANIGAANADANADDASMLIVTAMAYGPSGGMQATTDICLAPGAFGYVVISKMDMDMPMTDSGAMLSMADGIGVDGTMTTMNADGTTTTGPNHVYHGYVTLTASHRVKDCSTRTPSDEAVMIKHPDDPDDAANTGNTRIVNPAIAAWTIIQDVGDGFFGTEVPTPTVSTMRGENNVADASSQMLDCYDTDNDATDDGTQADDTEFNMTKCGLIPERHNNDRVATAVDASGTTIAYAVGAPDTQETNGFATPRAMAYVRYDTDDETQVFVWLGAGDTTIDVTVHCEEGMVTAIDDPSANTMDMLGTATLAVSDRTMIIDPTMGEVGSFTETCAGARGVLGVMMPDGSDAGMVWSHITQMGGHYRMNFPGYSMASPDSCRSTAVTDANDALADDRMARDMCM